jgi:hypothetical protein
VAARASGIEARPVAGGLGAANAVNAAPGGGAAGGSPTRAAGSPATTSAQLIAW